MSPTSHLRELDLLRKQVADLTRELTDRDQTFRDHKRELDDELQDLRERSDMLRVIVTGTATETGEDFFPTLVRHLSSVLGVQYAVVGEVQHCPIKKIRTIAVSAGGSLVDNFEYPLMNTPCETTLSQPFSCFERDVRTVFPLFERLGQLGVEGYCGVPLKQKGGTVIGLLALMDTKPLRNTDRLRSLMAVFASRAGAELQRRHSELQLQQQQRQLMEAQAHAHLGSWDWDLDSGTVHWSEEQFRIFGYEPGQMAVSYDTFVTSLHPLDRACVQSAIETALKGGTTYDVECRIIRPDRTIRAVHCRGTVSRSVDDRPVSLSSSVLDITDRQRVEEELKLSRKRLTQALRASGTGLWSWNTETDQVVLSEEWKRQLGYGGTELPDAFETWTTLLHPEDREGAIAYARQYQTSPDGDYRQEFRLRHKDGTYRWIEARASFATEADGRRMHLLGSHSDVTDRKRMEETIRESEERYRALVELSPSGVFVFCEGRTVYVNRTGALLMGAQGPQEILDRPTFEFIHPDYHHEVRESVKRLLGGGVSVHSAERVYVRMDGTTIPVQVETGRIMWDGKPAILVVFSDITERKQAEQALRESEERFAIAFRASPHPIGITEATTGRCIEVNDACLQLFGFSRKDVIGSTTLMLGIWPSEEDRAQFIKRLKTHRPVRNVEMNFKTKTGDVRHILVSSDLAELNGTLCLVTVGNDITDRKRAEEALADLNATLERQVDERTEALRRSEARFRQFFDNAPNVTCLKDHDGRYLYTNRRFEEVFHLAPGMALGKTDRELFPPAQADQLELHDRQVFGEGRGQEFEEVMQQKDGSHTSIVVKFPVTDTSGRLSALGVIATDVTERNRVQDALRESQARWGQFAESVSSAFWIADVTPDERKVLYVNSAFTFIWGIEREEIYQDWFLWLASIHPDDRLRVAASHDRFVGGGMNALFHCEYRIVGRDGHIRWISDRRVRMTGWEHRIAGIAEDITHHKQQVALLSQTEAIGKIGGWEVDFLTNRLSWSDETFRLHETTPELYSPTVETALGFYTPESRPRMEEAWGKGVTLGQSWDLELDLISAKGRRIAVRAAGKVDVLEGRAVRAYGTLQDITERKRAEEALWQAHDELERKVIERTAELQASEERYRSLYDETPSMYFTVDRMGIIRSVNQYGARYLGYRVEDLVGKSVETIIFEADRARIRAELEAFFHHPEGVAQWEFRKVRGDGTVLWVREFARVLQCQVGESLALIVCDDITDNKRAAEALRANEERYARATAIGKVGVWELDVLKGHYYGDTNLKMLFGYGPEELSTDPFTWLRLVHPDDQSVAMKNWEQVQCGTTDQCHYELRMVRKDGSVIWTDVRGHGVRDSQGRLTHLIGATVDITERKQAELALRESEERFSKAFRTSPHPIGITEAVTGRCVEVNDACLEAFGFRREEVIGNTTFLLGIWPSLEDRARVIERLKTGQPMRNMEFALKTKSGALRYFLASADLAELNGVLCVVTVANDITDRKQAEEALRMSEERFAKAFQASPHPVVISELDSGLIVDANEAAWQPFGYRKDEIVGHTTLQIGLWPSAEERAHYLELLKRQGSIRNMEVLLRSKSGDIRQCLLSSELIELNGKQCSVTVGNDITESRRLEEALRLTQFSVDQAVEAIMWLDPNARVFNVNDTACRMLEYSREELLGMTVHDIDPNFPVERWMDHWNYLKEQGSLTFEAKFWSRTGAVLETDVSVNYLLHEGKECACMILRDIGDRKRAEAELRRSHKFLRQVIDTAPNLIFAKDQAGRFAMANKAVADCYGTTVEDLIGKSDVDFNRNGETVNFFRQLDREVIQCAEDRFIPEERITDAEGKTRWLQTVKRPIFDDEGNVRMVLGAATDITERKRMEEMLLQRERDLNTALQERERISQDLHDGILQSLYAVGLGLEACKPMLKQQPGQVSAKFLAILDQTIGQLNQVMTEVRNFIAGLESHPIIEGGDFPTVLRDMVRAMSRSSAAKCTVRIDEAAVHQLSTEQALHIINIVREGLSNALRHSEAERITVSLRLLRHSVRLAITDDGIGFNTSSTQGVGHGLSNMAARAQKVRGVFFLQSTPRNGTKISLDLPKETTYAHN
ncbi:MAG: PAS domain S-box protein [Nitrospira sp.]|nr:PAS domain S-box protein [Nitrospira sp.]